MKQSMKFNPILFRYQVIVIALALGPASFLGLLLAMGSGPTNKAPFFGDFMTLTAVGVACFALFVNLAIIFMLRRWSACFNNNRVMIPFAIRTIAGAAVFTFATFFASVAMMLEHSKGAFILAILLLVAVASRFPTVSIARDWLQSDSLRSS